MAHILALLPVLEAVRAERSFDNISSICRRALDDGGAAETRPDAEEEGVMAALLGPAEAGGV